MFNIHKILTINTINNMEDCVIHYNCIEKNFFLKLSKLIRHIKFEQTIGLCPFSSTIKGTFPVFYDNFDTA